MAEENSTKNDVVINAEVGIVLDCLEWEILILDRQFKVHFANRAFLRKTGLIESEAVGNSCHKITHHLTEPCQPPNDTCPFEEMKKTGRPSVETHKHFDRNNQQFLANTVVAPLEGCGEGIFLHISMLVKDENMMKEETESALEKTLSILKIINAYQQQMRELNVTKNELETRIGELEKISKQSSEQEIKMAELKERIKELEKNRQNTN